MRVLGERFQREQREVGPGHPVEDHALVVADALPAERVVERAGRAVLPVRARRPKRLHVEIPDAARPAPPFGLDQLDQKQIRIIATGNDADAFKGQTVRLNIANANFLKAHYDIVDRYMKAYRETVSYLYTDPSALKVYADWLKITEAKAKRTRDDFFPRASIEPDKIVGLDTIVKDAVVLKYTTTELTKAQLDDLIHIPPR